MNTKNKSIASQALLEMDAITSAIKEESKKSINALLSEAVKNALRESANKDDEDIYEVQDDNNQKETSDNKGSNPKESSDSEIEGEDVSGNENISSQDTPDPNNIEVDAVSEKVPTDGQEEENSEMSQNREDGNGEESWDEFSDYQVGDSNTYDLTGEKDYDTVVKVYKLLNDEDQVVIKKEGDTINLQDNNAGTEYIIDLGEHEENPEDMNSEEMPYDLNESSFYEFDDSENDDETIDDITLDDEFTDDQDVIGHEDDDPFIYGDYEDYRNEDLGDFDEDEMAGFNDELYEGKIRKNKKTRKPMKESKEVLFEVDLGYTDNYQDKDPIAGLSNDEPAKGMKSWHKGIPTGTKKPWAGDTKSKGNPFKETQKVQGSVNEEDIDTTSIMNDYGYNGELEEGSTTVSSQSVAKKTRTQTSEPRANNARQVAKNVYHAGTRTDESKQLKTIKNENKELKKAILELRKSLNEAYITNVNLGKITKLFLENATSQEEKVDIVNRFTNEAKTIEQSNTLYESLSKQLKKKQQINLNESSVTANGTEEINSQKIYKTNDLLKTIDLMGRVLNC